MDEISVFLSYVRFHSIPELRETRHSRKAKPPFFERDEAAAADDQVVQHFAIQELSSLNHGAGHGDVIIIYMENLIDIATRDQ